MKLKDMGGRDTARISASALTYRPFHEDLIVLFGVTYNKIPLQCLRIPTEIFFCVRTCYIVS